MYTMTQASKGVNYLTEYNCHSNGNISTEQPPNPTNHAATVLQVKGWPHPLTMRGVNSKVDRNGRNAFVLACEPVCLCFNLLPYFIKVCVLLTLLVEKLCPLCEREKNSASTLLPGECHSL